MAIAAATERAMDLMFTLILPFFTGDKVGRLLDAEHVIDAALLAVQRNSLATS
jgi:hypothetical protein